MYTIVPVVPENVVQHGNQQIERGVGRARAVNHIVYAWNAERHGVKMTRLRGCTHLTLSQSTSRNDSKSSSSAAIQMVQPTDVRNRNDLATVRQFHLAWDGRIAFEREMRAGFVVVYEIRGKDASEMLLVEHDDMMKALSTDRSNDSLDVR